MRPPSISEHFVNTKLSIYHDHLDREHCELILKAYNDLEKIDNSGLSGDNLVNTERTSWFAHSESQDAAKVWSAISQRFFWIVNGNMGLDSPYINSVKMNLHESWIAVSSEDAFVRPHIHTPCPLLWSFVFYAKIPNYKSCLEFKNSEMSTMPINVREGDFLIFPSNILHGSNDTVAGRTVFSGNFAVLLN